MKKPVKKRKVKESSAKEIRGDKAMIKKSGSKTGEWEYSSADSKHDMAGMKKGGKVGKFKKGGKTSAIMC